MNKKTFQKGIIALMAIFPHIKIPTEFYWKMLSDISDEEYIKSINAIIKGTRELYPNTNLIAVIREKAKAQNRKLPGEAWQIVVNAIISVGSYGYPKFKDPLIAKSVLAMGWRYLCLSTNTMVDRAHFMKIYETFTYREDQERVAGPTTQLPDNICKLIENIGSNHKGLLS